ncbi:MAG: amidohydrolase [gamma proteobacterium symbiont of Bathyaustriella thionipta]|nr:amidohydrolase [gamma proteobacterium symbiont of Bathyaustriella thionipta]MCU7950652.1 amidohydrolase [gamma proteobacterium symbiont of Bathyaustriella thionipta]MCU7953744.1 amidohydrolase [gamma proteobacterium symbiont of Bathyaustriella thionipta]MCU7957143.1 amidohydrolase [gamma proteobacterium symbiont of Bathyaustriella thionipta]MCU7968440.1 amidohydrolase [gamma proteobacterium symbiont of Bathyaustriella thionipta]
MSLFDEVVTNRNKLQQWRHELHAIPEIAFNEEKTAQYVEQKLTSFGVTIHPRMAGTGIIASLSAGNSRKCIALRADLDALPIVEKTDVDYCSTHEGMMHACGHDGHTTMLLGAAHYLSQHQDFNGTVYFIFQPAEENEGGGRKLVEEGFFKKHPVDAIYGMHNWPGLEVGQFAIRKGPVMAAYDVFDITINGKGGHAAAPHNTVDPIIIAAQIVTAIQNISSRQQNPQDAVVISVTRIHAGDSYNVIPESAALSGTVRTFSHIVQEKIISQLTQIVDAICNAYGATAEVNYQKRYPSTINTEIETENALLAAMDVVGNGNIIRNSPPSMGSEDFSFLLNESKGCYVSIGNGSSAALHNPYYNFNDEILTIGVSYWVKLTQMQLS